jgi:Lon protease-like protein
MRLPLFLLNTVLFPGMALPLHIFEPRYREMIARCLTHRELFGVVLINTGAEVGGPAEPHSVGTSASITRVERLPDGRMNIETVGQERFRVLALHHDEAYLTGTVETFPLLQTEAETAAHAARALRLWLARYLSLFGEAAATRFDDDRLPQSPAAVAYLAAIVAQIPLLEKQTLLELETATELLEQERLIYRREVSLMRAMLTSGQSKHDPFISPN